MRERVVVAVVVLNVWCGRAVVACVVVECESRKVAALVVAILQQLVGRWKEWDSKR